MGFSKHSAYIVNGELYMWGSNTFGQCGLGHYNNVPVPTRVGNDNDWAYVALGSDFTIAIKKDGTLWAWGSGANYSLGNGSNAGSVTSPIMISSEHDWVKVACGYKHSIALKSDGTIWSWGLGSNGQLGHGNTSNQVRPTQIGTDNDWIDIGCGYYHSMAIKSDGSLWVWGLGQYGRLGLGDTNSRNSPTKVNLTQQFIKVEGSEEATIVLDKDGYAYGTGRNYYGELGLGNNTQKTSFVKLSGNKFVDVKATRRCFLFLDEQGNLWGSGNNEYGELGVGNTNQITTLTLIKNDVLAISTGEFHSNYLEKGSNRLYAAGNNASYELGNNTTTSSESFILTVNKSIDTMYNQFKNYSDYKDVLLNINISPTNIWYTEDIDVLINGTINSKYGETVQYRISLNNAPIYPTNGDYTDFRPVPISLNHTFSLKEQMNLGENKLKIEIQYNNNFQSMYEFILTLENKDTLKFYRHNKYNDEWLKDQSVIVSDGNLKLRQGKKIGKAETSILNAVRTYGKRKINKFHINATGDKLIELKDFIEFSETVDLDDGKLRSITIKPKDYYTILNISPGILFSGGSGTASDPFVIKTPEDLDKIRLYSNQSNVHFILANNIDLTNSPLNINGWTSISDFRGTLDGRGFSIIGLYKNALFNQVNNATIKNLSLINVDVNNSPLIITCNNSTIEKVFTNGTMTTTSNYNGGICSNAYGSTFKECGTEINIFSQHYYIGGFVGYLQDCTFIRCFYNGSIILTNNTGYIGGFVGYVMNTCKFSDCVSKGFIDLNNSTSAGGIFGCGYNLHVGGNSYIEYSYVATRIINKPDSSTVGGLVGLTAGLSEKFYVRNSYWDKETTGCTTSASSSSSYGLTTEQMKLPISYVGFNTRTKEDGSLVWLFPQNDYPQLNLKFTYVKMLLKINEQYYTYKNGELVIINVPLLTKDIFINEGMYVLPLLELKNFDEVTIFMWDNLDLDVYMLIDAIHEIKMRFLVSRDNKQTWHSYINNGWRQIAPSNIVNQGMTLDTINNISLEDWNAWFRRGIFHLMVYFESSSGTVLPYLTDFVIEFAPNEAPVVKNIQVTPTEVSRSNVVLTANIEDLEGDSYRYQILLNNKSIFAQNNGWSNWIEAENKVNVHQIFNYTDFRVGANYLVIVTEDDRGLRYISEPITITLTNQSPIFTMFVNDNWSLKASVIDADGDKVQYRITINNKQVFPKTIGDEISYTQFFSTPLTIQYNWSSSDLILGEENTVEIEIRDEFGGNCIYTIPNIIGKYRGLMFRNELGEYYSNDKGNILQFLDFGIIAAGQFTEPQKVILENQLGFPVENLRIFLNPAPTDYGVHLSKTNMPFVPQSELTFNDRILYDGDQVEFYVMVSSTTSTNSGGIFEIKATANPV